MGRAAQHVVLTVGGVLLVGLIVGAVVLTHLDSGSGSLVRPAQVGPAKDVVAPPPRGAVVLAGESGTNAVALAVSPGARPKLTATVLAQSGDPASGLPLAFRVNGKTIRARPCGSGCYTASVSRPRRVDVVLPGHTVAFDLPASTPSAAQTVARAARVTRRLSSLVYVESLRSGPTGGLLTTWRLKAPSEATYDIRKGAQAVIIGSKRWDRDKAGEPWRRSPQIPPLNVPRPAWGSVAVNAHLLGSARIGGHPVWVVSFANPTTPAWFTAWIDKSTYRPLRLKMTAAAHFMLHNYLAFDGPLKIAPPKTAR